MRRLRRNGVSAPKARHVGIGLSETESSTQKQTVTGKIGGLFFADFLIFIKN